MAERPDTSSRPEEQAAAEATAAAPAAGETAFVDAEAPPAPPAPAAPEAVAEAPAEDDEVARARQQAGEYLALAQRTQADFENYRKRMAREVGQATDRGVVKLAKELLPALDHFEHALRSVEGDEEVRKGFTLVRDELLNALGRVGIQAFSPQGEPFDPTQHEAMVAQPVEGAVSGTVVDVYQQGYRLNGVVLRPARVVVAA